MEESQPYVTIRTIRPTDGMSMSSGDSTVRGRVKSRGATGLLTSHQYGSSAGDDKTPSATHDTSRVNYHVKHISDFAKTLEDSAARAFPNRGRSQRYTKVQALLLHWTVDDLFVLPELQDLEQCFRTDYSFETDTFSIPSDNSHLELMMRVGKMIKEHESPDTLFIIYYGGHARIDESRQSTWCANRNPDSPWLQWSAIQTLLERSLSDVLILLDCCAGAASATFPNGNSITETISASSWDAIAPDPGRYSFTSALIEVLQGWKHRTYSAAMLHAEILARLKHPRPEMRNGRNFEARSTPVHFMMTSNHKAPSIEMSRVFSEDQKPPSPPAEPEDSTQAPTGRSGEVQGMIASEPNEDVPHVMISLALEDNQRLDVNAWESWLAAFPAIAKYVKVQGVFKSHSTLLLLSLPVMIWDLLPEDPACNFIAFIRSNNLATQKEETVPAQQTRVQYGPPLGILGRRKTAPAPEITTVTSNNATSSQNFMNQSKNLSRTIPIASDNVPNRPNLAPHVQTRLEAYFQENPVPSVAITEFLASNLGIETADIDLWFSHRRYQQEVANKLRSLPISDQRQEPLREGARMILPGHLNNLLEIVPPEKILLVDLRSPSEYERSHIHGSINFRVPASFVQNASLEMIERTLADDTSREIYNKWYTCNCIVFYDRHVEYAWECPTAEALIQKFRSKRWHGQGFILKGHYREFSDSFEKYIGGQRMTSNAKKYLESLQEKSHQKKKESHQEYNDWLTLLEDEDRVPPTELVPTVKAARQEATIEHQKSLEIELEQRMPSLYRKAMDLTPDNHWSIKAPIVEHLARGLEKMQQSSRGGEDSRHSSYPDKLQQGKAYDDPDMIESDEELHAKDIAHEKRDAKLAPEESSGPGADPKKVRRMWNRLRSGK